MPSPPRDHFKRAYYSEVPVLSLAQAALGWYRLVRVSPGHNPTRSEPAALSMRVGESGLLVPKVDANVRGRVTLVAGASLGISCALHAVIGAAENR